MLGLGYQLRKDQSANFRGSRQLWFMRSYCRLMSSIQHTSTDYLTPKKLWFESHRSNNLARR